MHKHLLNGVLGVLLAGGLPGSFVYANHHASPEKFSAAITVSRSGSFELDLTPDEALPLFTAPGEKLWITGWNPVVRSGDGLEKGTVFVTEHHGHKTHWIVMDYDTQARHALYVRVTPDLNTGTVDVSVKPNGTGGSVVNVTYQLTGLSPIGNEKLQEAFSEPKYAQMMEDWRSMINSNRKKIDEHFSR